MDLTTGGSTSRGYSGCRGVTDTTGTGEVKTSFAIIVVAL